MYLARKKRRSWTVFATANITLRAIYKEIHADESFTAVYTNFILELNNTPVYLSMIFFFLIYLNQYLKYNQRNKK